MLCLSGFELYSRWVPLRISNTRITCPEISSKLKLARSTSEQLCFEFQNKFKAEF